MSDSPLLNEIDLSKCAEAQGLLRYDNESVGNKTVGRLLLHIEALAGCIADQDDEIQQLHLIVGELEAGWPQEGTA